MLLPVLQQRNRSLQTESAGISSHYGTVQYNDSLKRYVINLGNKVFQLSTYSAANCIVLPEQDLPTEYKKVGAEVIVTGAISAKRLSILPTRRFILFRSPSLKAMILNQPPIR